MNYPQNGFGQQFPPAPQPVFQQPAFQNSGPQYQPQPQPQYQQPFQQPQVQQPPAPVIRSTLADAVAQGVKQGGYGTTVKFQAPGAIFDGIVARDLTDMDTSAETDFATKQPKPDGRGGYRLQITIPLNTQPSQQHPEGKGTMWAKGRLLTAVVHAMVAAGIDIQNGESLKEGDRLQVQRVADVPTNKGNPAHDFVAQVTRGNGQGAQAAVQAPVSVPSSMPAPATVPVNPLPDMTTQYQQQAAQFTQSAGVQYQAPQQGFTPAPAPAAMTGASATPAPAFNGTPGLVPGSYQEILVRSLTGGQVTPEEQAILNAGPPQQ